MPDSAPDSMQEAKIENKVLLFRSKKIQVVYEHNDHSDGRGTISARGGHFVLARIVSGGTMSDTGPTKIQQY